MRVFFNKIKYIIKQFPFIYPKSIFFDTKKWIEKNNRSNDIYNRLRTDYFVKIDEEESHFFSLPINISTNHKSIFSVNQNYVTTSKYLYKLNNIYIFGNKGAIITNRNVLLAEFTHNFNINNYKKFVCMHPFYFFTTKYEKIDGVSLSLLSPEIQNYYHWTFDVLPRIRYYSKIINDIDNILLPYNIPQVFIDQLVEFGVSLSKVKKIHPNKKYLLNQLFVSSLSQSEGRYSTADINFLLSNLNSSLTTVTSRKIYIKRGNVKERIVINEDELCIYLTSRGYEIVDTGNISLSAQKDLFQNATIIISAHGAALTNIIYSKKGTKLLEIFSQDYFRTDCYYTLSQHLGIDYYYYLANRLNGNNWGDIYVDINTLKELLFEIESAK